MDPLNLESQNQDKNIGANRSRGFWVMLGQTNKQTDRQTNSHYNFTNVDFFGSSFIKLEKKSLLNVFDAFCLDFHNFFCSGCSRTRSLCIRGRWSRTRFLFLELYQLLLHSSRLQLTSVVQGNHSWSHRLPALCPKLRFEIFLIFLYDFTSLTQLYFCMILPH